MARDGSTPNTLYSGFSIQWNSTSTFIGVPRITRARYRPSGHASSRLAAIITSISVMAGSAQNDSGRSTT